MRSEIKLAITVAEALRFKIPMDALRLLASDGNTYIPLDCMLLQDSLNTIRFRTTVDGDQEYFIRKLPGDYIFSTLDEREIHLKFALSGLLDLKINLRRDCLEQEDFVTLDKLIRSVSDKLGNKS